MIELFYSAIDLACIIYSHDMGQQAASTLLEKIWHNEKAFLLPGYRDDLRKLYLDVYYWQNYLCDKPNIDKEFPSVQKDFDSLGKDIKRENFITDFFDVNLFFKAIRLQILYLGEQGYVRMKLRTILSAYGYRRRTPEFIRYFNERLLFYHMQTYIRGEKECDISKVKLDDMIMIRVI